MPFAIHALTSARLGDLDAVFQARGCAEARGCYCMYYRWTSREYGQGNGRAEPARKRAALAALAEGELPPGLLAYDGEGHPAGWVSLGPRADFARLAGSRIMRAVDDAPVWSIVCFVVPSACRRQGVAHALLAAAVRFARERGASQLEATRSTAAWPARPRRPGSDP